MGRLDRFTRWESMSPEWFWHRAFETRALGNDSGTRGTVVVGMAHISPVPGLLEAGRQLGIREIEESPRLKETLRMSNALNFTRSARSR